MLRNRAVQMKLVKDQESDTPATYKESPNTPEAAAIEVLKESAKYAAMLIVLNHACRSFNMIGLAVVIKASKK